jgi:hypothetical protein
MGMHRLRQSTSLDAGSQAVNAKNRHLAHHSSGKYRRRPSATRLRVHSLLCAARILGAGDRGAGQGRGSRISALSSSATGLTRTKRRGDLPVTRTPREARRDFVLRLAASRSRRIMCVSACSARHPGASEGASIQSSQMGETLHALHADL